MGAEQFTSRVTGKTAEEAFQTAIKAAQYEHGHGGYTGTIAEKDSFVLLTPPNGTDPGDFVDKGLDGVFQPGTPERVRAAFAAIEDKYGPAGCVQFGPDEFVFFGWASS
jgi:hypothetical protein